MTFFKGGEGGEVLGTYNWKKERGQNKRNSKKQESNNNKENER